MIRFIIKYHHKDRANGLVTEGFETVDIDVPRLEDILNGGGFAEDGYDYRELLGVEILRRKDS